MVISITSIQTENEELPTVVIDFNSQGNLYAKSQVTDYVLRDQQLHEHNVLEYFTNTYERRMTRAERELLHTPEDDSTSSNPRRGRRPNPRAFYLPGHPKSESVTRIIRTAKHNNLPNIIGARFPSSNEDTCERSSAFLLMLMKPWRNLETDLKGGCSSWQEAFDAFMNGTTKERRDVVSGIKYLNESHSAIEHDTNLVILPSFERSHIINAEEDGMLDNTVANAPSVYDEEGLKAIIRAQTSWGEQAHAQVAVQIGKLSGIFEDINNDTWEVDKDKRNGKTATLQDLNQLQIWRKQIEQDVDHSNQINVNAIVATDPGDIQRVQGDDNTERATVESTHMTHANVIPPHQSRITKP